MSANYISLINDRIAQDTFFVFPLKLLPKFLPALFNVLAMK